VNQEGCASPWPPRGWSTKPPRRRRAAAETAANEGRRRGSQTPHSALLAPARATPVICRRDYRSVARFGGLQHCELGGQEKPRARPESAQRFAAAAGPLADLPMKLARRRFSPLAVASFAQALRYGPNNIADLVASARAHSLPPTPVGHAAVARAAPSIRQKRVLWARKRPCKNAISLRRVSLIRGLRITLQPCRALAAPFIGRNRPLESEAPRRGRVGRDWRPMQSSIVRTGERKPWRCQRGVRRCKSICSLRLTQAKSLGRMVAVRCSKSAALAHLLSIEIF